MQRHEISAGKLKLSKLPLHASRNTISIGNDCDLYDSLQDAMIVLKDNFEMNSPLGSGWYYGNFHMSPQGHTKSPDGTDWNDNSAFLWMDKMLKGNDEVDIRIGWFTGDSPSPVSVWNNEKWAGGSVSINFLYGDTQWHITIANKKHYTLSDAKIMLASIRGFFV